MQAAKTNMEDRSSPDDINRKSKVKVNKHKLRTARLESEIEELLHDSDEYIAPFTAVPDDMKPDAPSSPNNTVSSKTVSVLPLDTTSQLLGESINTEVNSSATALPNEYAVPRVASDTNNSNSGISLSSDARKLLGTYDDDEVLLEMDSDSMDEAEDPRHHMEEHDDVDSQEMSDDEYFAKNLITELSLSN